MAHSRFNIAGNLTKDPETRYAPSGKPITEISVAVSRTIRGSGGATDREETSFFDIVLFGTGAEGAQQLKKGESVQVDGEMVQETWEDKDTKKKRSKVALKAFVVAKAMWPPRDGQRPQGATPRPPTAAEKPTTEVDDVPF